MTTPAYFGNFQFYVMKLKPAIIALESRKFKIDEEVGSVT